MAHIFDPFNALRLEREERHEHLQPLRTVAERLDELELDRLLEGVRTIGSGDLNSSHYYRIFQPRL